MPHEVIMPALGMAQETGLIVAWLKQPGDAVRAGEALIEVETDKAVMEVEALADGFLTDIRAAAGDAVPVGKVIALISENADVMATSPVPAPPPATGSTSTARPEGQAIIMPALGMAQETGRLVAWLKAPGDAVAAEDILLEVETDKSTMEVPAGHDGFIAALLAEAGQDVPVGEIIAVISATRPDAPTQQRAAAPSVASAPAAAPKTVATAAPVPKAARIPATGSNGRVLASPKARRLAAEQGLDLARLVAMGHPEPFHVADLDLLRQLSAAPTSAGSVSQPTNQITACVSIAGTSDFLTWMLEEGGITLRPQSLWASFACAAYREAADLPDANVTLELLPLGAPALRLSNPDHARLSAQPEADAEASTTLVLRDLTQSPITAMRLTAGPVPILNIGRDGDSYTVTLDFTANHLTDEVAIALMTGFAGRMAEPLRHLL